MTLLWLGPLVTLGFMAGFLISAILLRMGRLSRPASWIAALGLPFGCATLPVLILAALSLFEMLMETHSPSTGM
ncbi:MULTISPECIES: hypothetical protein [Novosphingobium]|uniref:Uncharacterized protein n=2 Tax=Novosphingobium TaxID=165696 RepID=A0ABT0AAK1_9SPHN|nr:MULTISPECIES: hypothetical protein [Novosphingobium]MCJ1960233.1 hypothetical protein [Novosphingobium mangrovi (ex Hu et al. 2023)]MED5544937.1 hypothetical protein [Pseudomonadota bacterium]QVM84336.1 hypothetical protein HT578_12120 [Novosphingobium decolorationis]